MTDLRLTYASGDGLHVLLPPPETWKKGTQGLVVRDARRAIAVQLVRGIPPASEIGNRRGPDVASEGEFLTGWFGMARNGRHYLTLRSPLGSRRCWQRESTVGQSVQHIVQATPDEYVDYAQKLFRRPKAGGPGLEAALLDDIEEMARLLGVASKQSVRDVWRHISEDAFEDALSTLHRDGRVLLQEESIRPLAP